MNALWEKPFINQYFLHKWHETSHVLAFGTSIANQHSGSPLACPHNTQRSLAGTIAKEGSI
jgi:hypothetical protein